MPVRLVLSRRLLAKGGRVALIVDCVLLLDSKIGYPSKGGNFKAILINQLP
jgi:hypothetical protein